MSGFPERRREDLPEELEWLVKTGPDGNPYIALNSTLTDEEAHAAEKEALAAYNRDQRRQRWPLALPLIGGDSPKKRQVAAAAVALVVASVAVAAILLPGRHHPDRPSALRPAPNPRTSASQPPAPQPPSHRPQPSEPAPRRTMPGPDIRPVRRHHSPHTRTRSPRPGRVTPPPTHRKPPPPPPAQLQPAAQDCLVGASLDLIIRVRLGVLCPLHP